MRIEPVDASLGATVTDVSLADLDDDVWYDVLDAFHAHALLIFPGQHLSDDEQVGFARRFGEIEHVVADRDTITVGNQRRDGSLLEPDSSPMQAVRGNVGWHTDSSYMPLAAKASVLSAQVVPSRGGQTEWADMRAAHDALDTSTRGLITGRCAHHSYRYSQQRDGYEDRTVGYGFDQEPQLRPLVKVHPVTGRPALYIGRHAHAVTGLDPERSERVLDGLLDFACRPPRLHRHDWDPGDVVVWDNRCVLHRLVPWDYVEPRRMRHTRVAGDPATESALAS